MWPRMKMSPKCVGHRLICPLLGDVAVAHRTPTDLTEPFENLVPRQLLPAITHFASSQKNQIIGIRATCGALLSMIFRYMYLPYDMTIVLTYEAID